MRCLHYANLSQRLVEYRENDELSTLIEYKEKVERYFMDEFCERDINSIFDRTKPDHVRDSLGMNHLIFDCYEDGISVNNAAGYVYSCLSSRGYYYEVLEQNQ